MAAPEPKVEPSPALAGAESPRSSWSGSRAAAQTPPLAAPKTSTAVEKKRSGPPPKEAPARAPASFRMAYLAPTPVAAPAPEVAPAIAIPAASVARAAPVVATPVAVPPPVPTAVAAPAPAPTPRVVAFRELPAAVQGALPNIVFGGFAGGGEAEGRIAFINNRLVREGEEVSPGLRLETVDQDGVVLGFQGHHFRTGQ